jgi:hypothetical protein
MVLDSTARPTTVGSIGAYTAAADPELVRYLREQAGVVTVAGAAGLRVLASLERDGDVHGVDLDPATYLSKDNGQLSLTPMPWIERQRELNLRPVRSAGVFVPHKGSLRDALAEPLDDDVHRVISLHQTWLRPDNVTELVRALGITSGALSLIFAAPFDPFASAGAIRSLRHVLLSLRDEGREVELLRCDLTALGFVADGGRRGTIGVTSNARHHPQPLGRKAGEQYEQRQCTPNVFIPQLLSWQRGSWLHALAPYNGAGLTECPCTGCDGQSLLRFADQWPGQVPEDVRHDARAHDVASWRRVADEVLASVDPAAAWQARVRAAADLQQELAADKKVLVELPPSLTAWDDRS